MPAAFMIEATMICLAQSIGPGLCFEIITRLCLDHGLQFQTKHENEFLVMLAMGLDSKRQTVRRAAFDCAFAMHEKYGLRWANALFAVIRTCIGSPRDSVIRTMIDNRKS